MSKHRASTAFEKTVTQRAETNSQPIAFKRMKTRNSLRNKLDRSSSSAFITASFPKITGFLPRPEQHASTLQSLNVAKNKVFDVMRKNPYRPKGVLKVPLYILQSMRGMPYRASMADGLPVPSNRMIYSVIGTPSVETFLNSSAVTAKNMLNALEKNGIDIRRFNSILDFGCGCGRILRQWKSLNINLYGTDYNPKLIRWCKTNLPFAKFETNQLMPPLNYRNEQFDFIYAFSVFTHLNEQQQEAWKNEILRVLKPGGFFLMTTHGENYLKWLTPEEQERFQQGQLVFQVHGRYGSNSVGAIQSLKQVQNQFGDDFEIVDFVPHGSDQDIYIMKKRVTAIETSNSGIQFQPNLEIVDAPVQWS
jgi:ubiquinone/menaquinone biosynthesis C-methylase UbiE